MASVYIFGMMRGLGRWLNGIVPDFLSIAENKDVSISLVFFFFG